MPRFLDDITIIDKNGREFKASDIIPQGSASSSIDGASTWGTWVIRGTNNNRFQVDDPVSSNDAVNKRYADQNESSYDNILDGISDEVSNWLFTI